MKKCTVGFLFLIALGARAQDGRQLAERYCASCHVFPAPELLTKQVWRESVLPNMARRLGLKIGNMDYLDGKSPEERALLKKLNTYPDEAQIGMDDWVKIQTFYESEAPEQAVDQKAKNAAEVQTLFRTEELKINGIDKPNSTLLFFKEEQQTLFLGTADPSLFAIDQYQEIFSLPAVSSPPVLMQKRDSTKVNLMCVGQINPSDLSTGRVYEIDFQKGAFGILIDSLARPVDMLWADLENDGVADLLLCEYGNNIGGLSVYKNGDPHKKEWLSLIPGARKVEVHDLNGDGLLDIVFMSCQAREHLSVFYNLGEGQFEEKEVLTFNPAMGLSYFEMQDFNRDGHLDILLSNGDNWDYSSIHKAFHGIRIYLNDGADNFEEAWFYPQYGTIKSMATDFDQDGDLDIVSIAFYDNLEKPEEQFLYFENLGELKFKASFLPESAKGKWICMELADKDGDGDTDVFLGSYLHSMQEYTQLLFQGLKDFPNVLILENTVK
ncbi:VCBS repeat-containing protein [Marinilongibacter aquaticus]|uniref:FG-GAP repeat domain-containing protein n=1 Tax=Marinilongibacter aquaticus TaxID=2975157 RepID=UPI0021BD7CAF|nr:VCBS repeat-containing protein [Marinilongibacter aquaticus]UBM60191.1 VCBS repeat-containing protein [Marinilongibacter aquaticus]